LGGSPRPLELHRAVFPGAVGLACLISLAVGRPLLLIAAIKRREHRPQTATQTTLDTPGAHHALRVVTALIGITLTADAVAQVALALTVSTSTFGVVAHIASWAIIGTGLTVGVVYVRRIRVRIQDPTETQPPPPEPKPQPDRPAVSARARKRVSPGG
jgi:hypothetical protein